MEIGILEVDRGFINPFENYYKSGYVKDLGKKRDIMLHNILYFQFGDYTYSTFEKVKVEKRFFWHKYGKINTVEKNNKTPLCKIVMIDGETVFFVTPETGNKIKSIIERYEEKLIKII